MSRQEYTGIKVVITADGSPTLHVPGLNEYYHSVKGAVQESQHVYIKNGLNNSEKKQVRLFEVGFGTGLNASLSCMEAEKRRICLCYHTIELFPVEKEIWQEMLINLKKSVELAEVFKLVNEAAWDSEIQISPFFKLKKIRGDMVHYRSESSYDVIYFDAFAPGVQEEMWSRRIFGKIFRMMNPGAVLSTFSASGPVKRNMEAEGLVVKRIPGPPGKREIITAVKPDAR